MAAPAATPWLVKHPSEWRQIGIVAVYNALLGSMYFVPACRNALFFAAACYFSFLNCVVIHNHLHQGIFHAKALTQFWLEKTANSGFKQDVTTARFFNE